MRIALVSPYSWTYPGGVTRHIEALAEQYLREGHDVRVLTPSDPDDRMAARTHRGARPQERGLAPYVVPLGRTIGIPANGAMSNVSVSPSAVRRLREELSGGGFDVAHVHEPSAYTLSWGALADADVPLVGTFHAYSTNRLSNNGGNILGAARRMHGLDARIAVSQAAAWTGRRFFGGRYRIVPNGVHVPDAIAPKPVLPASRERPLKLLFVGQAVSRKGLPILLRAYEALRAQLPVTLTVIGADEGELEPLILDPAGIEILGRVDDAEKERRLREADLLVAPSLGSESFGMVLTEAFAAGTPVVASDIAGYRDVVRDGLDGVLVPRGDATALAEAICDLVLDPPRRAAMAASAAERARRYAWPRVAGEVMDVYHEAIEAHAQGAPVKRPAERRLEPLDVDERSSRERWVARGRRAGMAGAMLGGAGLGFLALERIGLPQIAANLLTSRPDWLLIGLGLMCAAMVMRGFSWHAILRAALPHTRVRRRDAMQGTFIGVLMSATLPGRLGELSRSVIVARRVGRPRESLPVVIGTIVSQTLLNLLALAILGVIMFSSVNIGNHGALLLAAIAPVAALLVVLIVPLLLRGGVARSRRAAQLRSLLTRVRAGLRVFRSPRLGAIATGSQLAAWALQCASCYALLVSLGIDSHAGLAAAAGVLFAVNVSAVLPVTPSNLGVFQFACVTVLATFGVGRADALAYGIILQAVEIATAVLMGMPALVREGLSWKDVKLRAMQSAPVELRDRRAVHPGALVRG